MNSRFSSVFDPLRRREVPLTPEENVRQWFITVLKDQCKVPPSLMMSEASFKLGSKSYRADILVWDRELTPLAVVECKKEAVKITADVLDQAIRYSMALPVSWLFLTNGQTTLLMKRNGDRFEQVNYLPDYERLLQR